jgi:hypothetical protein
MPSPSNARSGSLEAFFEAACGPDSPVSPLGDLDNPIHAMLCQRHFQQAKPQPDGTLLYGIISDAAYDAITPALRLATLFLTETLGPFDHVANGVVAYDKDGDAYIRRGICEGSTRGLAYVEKIFEYMARRIVFIFHGEHAVEDIDDYPDAMVTWNRDSRELVDISFTREGHTYTRQVCDNQALVWFHTPGWLHYLEHEMVQDRPAYQLNALLQFTSTLMHELMHVFFGFTSNGHPFSGALLEPRMNYRDTWHELGWQYQSWLFGRVLSAEHSMRDPSYNPRGGSTVTTYSKILLLVGTDGETTSEYPCKMIVVNDDVSTLYVSRATRALFLKSTWQRIREEGHGFWISEANRTQLEILKTAPRLEGQSQFVGLQLMYDGEVYSRLTWRQGAAEDHDSAVGVKEVPGAKAWDVLERPQKRKRVE